MKYADCSCAAGEGSGAAAPERCGRDGMFRNMLPNCGEVLEETVLDVDAVEEDVLTLGRKLYLSMPWRGLRVYDGRWFARPEQPRCPMCKEAMLGEEAGVFLACSTEYSTPNRRRDS